MTWLFVLAHPPQALRLEAPRSADRPSRRCRVTPHFPKPAWLRDRLARAGLAAIETSAASDEALPTYGAPVVGLLNVSPGSVWDDLTMFSEEAKLMRDYYLEPPDVHTFHVRTSFRIVDGSLVVSARASEQFGPVKFSQKHLVFEPTWGFAEFPHVVLESQAGRVPLQTLLGDQVAHNAWCLWLPEPVAHLASLGEWTELVVLSRWYVRCRAKRAIEFYTPMDDFPSSDWIHRTSKAWRQSCSNVVADTPVPQVAQLAVVARRLRMWSQDIVGACEDEEEAAQRKHELRGAIEVVEHFSRRLSGKAHGPHVRHMRFQYSQLQILHSHRCSRLLKNRGQLRDAVEIALSLTLPDCVDAHAYAQQQPSHTTVWRSHFFVDVAMLLYMQNVNKHDGPRWLRFAWCDSSPILHHDWLMVRYMRIREDAIERVWRAAIALALDRHAAERRWRAAHGINYVEDSDASETAGSDGEEEEMLHTGLTVEQRQEFNQLLVQQVIPHVAVPCALEQGHANLMHKCAAIVHGLSMECASRSDLSEAVASIRTLTTDMGTEQGIADACVPHGVCLPPWYRPEGGRVVNEDCEDEQNRASFVDGPHMFQNCIHIPGMLHILHNLEADVDSKMENFMAWFADLKNSSMLLSRPEACRVVFVSCVAGTMHDKRSQALFDHATPRLYEKRWGYVIDYLLAAWPRLLVLRECWSEARFLAAMGNSASGDAEDGDEANVPLQAQQFTKMLASNAWFLYARMVITLHSIARKLRGWSEGCVCHDFMRKNIKDRGSFWRRSLQKDFGVDWVSSCPLAGMRAPEMAAGAVLETFDNFASMVFDRFKVEVFQLQIYRVSPQDLQVVLLDFDRGRAAMELCLRLKTQCWQSLPWLLFGLSHHDEGVARRIACRARGQFEATPIDARPCHHRATRYWLDPAGPCRAGIDQFIEGAAREHLPLEVRREICILRFGSVAERVIEAVHKDVKKDAGYNAAGPVAVSASVRDHVVLEAQLRRDPSRIVDILDCLQSARSSQRIPGLLGVAQHPLLHGKFQTWQLIVRVAKVVYRCEMDAAFADLSHEARQHRRERLASVRQSAKHLPLPAPLSEQKVLHHALVQHIRELAGAEDVVCSLPRHLVQRAKVTEVVTTRRFRDDVAHPNLGRLLCDGVAAAADDRDLFFTVVNANPAALKRVPAPAIASASLQATSLAIIPLEEAFTLPGEKWLRADPGSVSIIEGIAMDLATLRARGRRWDTAPTPGYGFDGLDDIVAAHPDDGLKAKIVSDIVQKLMNASALPGTDQHADLGDTCDEARCLIEHMHTRGLMNIHAEGLRLLAQLSEQGLQRLVLFRRICLDHSLPLCDVRELVQLEDKSTFELMCMVAQDGWSWAPRRSSRDGAFNIGEPKVWRTSGVVVHSAYLRVLLSLEKLQRVHGIGTVPHCQKSIVYERMLEGKSWESQLEDGLVQLPQKRRRSMINDVEPGFGNADHLLMPDRGELAGARAVAELEPEGGQMGHALEIMMEEDIQGLLDMIAEEEAGAVVEASAPEMAQSPCGEASERHDAVGQPQGRAAVDAPIDNLLEKPPAWGCFTFSRKQPKQKGGGNAFGAYEITCPWHMRSQRSGCKKLIRILGPDVAAKQYALRVAKHWASQARLFERQWQHIFTADVSLPPSDELLETRRIDEKPDKADIEDDEAYYARNGGRARQKRAAPAAEAKRPAVQEEDGPRNTASRASSRKSSTSSSSSSSDSDSE